VPAERSLTAGLLPLGLAHGIALKRDIAEGESLRWNDVAADEADRAIKVRREMEHAFAPRAAERAPAHAL
jgi:predicted homoserine dehydrogenase-like protein